MKYFFIYFLLIASLCCCAQSIEEKVGSRQIHLDFHTSDVLEDIGGSFDKVQFQEALKVGHVNTINIFGKCHHGLTYYPTKVGIQHPHLNFDLLGAQIEACHEIDVRCPIYFTVGLSELEAIQHPEWCLRKQDGTISLKGNQTYAEFEQAKPTDPKPNGQWYHMCQNTSYHEHMIQQVEEICANYDVDGFWFDIYNAGNPCYCETCKQEMKDQNIDLDDIDAVLKFRSLALRKHMKEMVETIEASHPEATVFFNGTTAIFTKENFLYNLYEFNSYQDLEDLPTTSWCDYDRLPIQSKHYLKEGYQVTGMSGKFHTGWGEFGGFKDKNAIKYEAAAMISYGVHCNIGDQLHPSGLMDMGTYQNIGYAFDYVNKIEAYGIGGVPKARLGIWRSYDNFHDEALGKMLLQAQIDFDIANKEDDLTIFETILVPDIQFLTKAEATKLNAFVKAGGGLIVLGDGALNEEGTGFILDVGASYVGEAKTTIDYLVMKDQLGNGMIKSPFLNYEPAMQVKPAEGTKVLATIREPYFNRTMAHFCGHQNTPYRLEDADHPGIIKHGNVIFFAHNISKMYAEHGLVMHRNAFENAVRMLHQHPILEVEMPSASRVNVLQQKDKNRYVVHLLYGPKIQRGAYEIIEDLPTLSDVVISVDFDEKIKSAYLIPSNKKVKLQKEGDRLTMKIPPFSCHTGVVFNY